MRYRNWAAVRVAIELRENRSIPEQTWLILQDKLIDAATHPPLDEWDIDFAIKRFRTLEGQLAQKGFDDV